MGGEVSHFGKVICILYTAWGQGVIAEILGSFIVWSN